MVELLGCNWQRHRGASPRQSNMWRWSTGTHPTDQWLLQSVSHLPPLRSDNGYFQLDVPYVPAEYVIYVEEVEHHLHKRVKHIIRTLRQDGFFKIFPTCFKHFTSGGTRFTHLTFCICLLIWYQVSRPQEATTLCCNICQTFTQKLFNNHIGWPTQSRDRHTTWRLQMPHKYCNLFALSSSNAEIKTQTISRSCYKAPIHRTSSPQWPIEKPSQTIKAFTMTWHGQFHTPNQAQ